MLKICEKFAYQHNLTFSTDTNPSKCKTKYTAFLRKPMLFGDTWLCGNKLPWVDQFKHLGNTINNKFPYTDQDILIKRAQFINKSVELNQEFFFATSRTKFEVNQIYNSHFYGSPIWDLFDKCALKLESTYNQGVKVMFDLPVSTHRMLIEPVSGQIHIRKTLISRFLGFLQQIKNSKKTIPKILLSNIMYDVRSTTGKNLRNILLLANKSCVDMLRKSDVQDISYHQAVETEKWRVDLINELIDTREGKLMFDGITDDEVNEMINHLCIS